MFGLIDCNSFYCSCERLFRPDLENKAVVVLSNNDGCAIARTQEAKDFGIEMGEPYFKIKKRYKKNEVAIFSSNFANYTNISQRVMNIIRDHSPLTEVYSVDEAFTDVSGITDLKNYGLNLKDAIYKNVGIPVGVGIAPTKVLAKLANRIAKKSKKAIGVVVLDTEMLQNIALKMVKIEDVWGIGKQSSIKLQRLGIKTAYDFKIYENEKLIQSLLTKVGLQIKDELMGIACLKLEQSIPKKKEIMCSRSFGQSVLDLNVLKESIANYITNAAHKMRQQESHCTYMSIFARTSPFKDIPQHYLYETLKLTNPTSDTRLLIKQAFELLDRGYKEGVEYHKAGVKLSGFFEVNEFQLDFLSLGDSLESIQLMKALDSINLKLGDDKVRSMACGFDKRAWAMNRNHKSPRYLTSWDELFSF